MKCPRCKATTAKGVRCKNLTCMQYPYCWIHLRSVDGLQIRDSSIKGFGKGLFATREHKKDKKITNYSAKQIDTLPNRTCGYALEVGKNRYLNAIDKSNYVGRYINDSRGTSNKNNLRFTKSRRVYYKENRYMVPIYTKKKIKKGEELFLNYGKSYFKNRCK